MEQDEDGQRQQALTRANAPGSMQPSALPARASSNGGDGVMLSPKAHLPVNEQAFTSNVLTWGCNGSGELGVTGTTQSVPHCFSGTGVFSRLACGTSHSLAINSDGELFSWGSNFSSEIGRSSDVDEFNGPKQVGTLSTKCVADAAAGDCFSAVVTNQGEVFCFGDNSVGQCGQGHAEEVLKPKLVRPLMGQFVTRVACGGSHCLVLTAMTAVLSWGGGRSGCLGHGDAIDSTVPRVIKDLDGVGTVGIAAGEAHSVAWTAGGTLFVWGRGKSGQLGLASFGNRACLDSVPRPRRLPSLTGVKMAACGAEHTVVVTGKGLFAFGRGNKGQLGRGSTADSSTPVAVRNVQAKCVVQICCGAHHTLLLMKNGAVMGFGAGENGQIGDADMKDKLIPVGVPFGSLFLDTPQTSQHVDGHLPKSGALLQISSLSSGTYHCMAIVQPADGRNAPPCAPAVRLLSTRAVKTALSAGNVSTLIEQCLSSVGVVVASFLNDGGILDASGIEELYKLLLETFESSIISTVQMSLSRLLSSLQAIAPMTAKHEAVAAIIFLMCCPLNSHAANSGIFKQALSLLLAIDKNAQKAAIVMMSKLPIDIFAARVLRPIKLALESVIENEYGVQPVMQSAASPERPAMKAPLPNVPADAVILTQALSFVYAANQQNTDSRLPRKEFYVDSISPKKIDFINDYIRWHSSPHASGAVPFSFARHPMVLNNDAKRALVAVESSLKMQQTILTSMAEGQHIPPPPPSKMASGSYLPPPAPPVEHPGFLIFHIRRDSLVQDALYEVGRYRPLDLGKPLRVIFFEEEGIDEGGVRKEFFQLLVEELFSPDYGMFSFNEETRTHWLNANAIESDAEFYLVGVLLGLAIHNGVILDVHFPEVVFKKLLGGKAVFEDLKSVFPELHRSFEQILEYDGPGSVEDVFYATFQVATDFFGEIREHDLLPNGGQIPVTESNRQEYVEKYSDWLMNVSIEFAFSKFRDGFLSLCGGPAVSVFTPEELEIQVCGLPHLDFYALQSSARYDGGFTHDTPVIIWLWRTVLGWDIEKKKKFLSFVTGSFRAPPGGLGTLTITVQRDGTNTDRLPTSHTCFNVLLLPEYETEEKLKRMLSVSIENAKGFGLK